MTWLLLALWWVVLPVIPGFAWLHWIVHLVATSLLALLMAGRLWRVPRVHLSVPVVATLAAVVSLFIAMHVAPERFPVNERWWEGMRGLGYALFFVVALIMVPLRAADSEEGAVSTEDGRSRGFRIGLSVLLAGVLLAQLIVVIALDLDEDRISGGLGNPNTLGALVASLGLALAAFARWPRKALVGLALLGVMIVLTRSRGAAASGALVLLIFTARRNWRWVLGLGGALGLALVFVPNPLWERVVQLETDHYFSRPFLWNAALQNVLENPLGIGPAMNRYVFPLSAFDPELPWLVHQRHAVGLTHNVFLTLALEWGWLAGAAGLGLALWTLAHILPRRPVDPLRQGATLGALVLFCELQVDGLEQNSVVFSVFLLFAAIVIRRAIGVGHGPAFSGRVAASVLALAALWLLTQAAVRTSWVEGLQSVRDTWHAYRTGEGSEDDVRLALASAEEVSAAEEFLADIRFQLELQVYLDSLNPRLGHEELRTLEERAWSAAESARLLNPADPVLARSISNFTYRAFTRSSSDEQARTRHFSSMRRLLELDPLDVTSRRKLARAFANEGKFDLMEEAFEELFAIEPDDAAAWALRGRYRMLQGDTEGALYAYVRAQEAVFNCRVKARVDAPRSRLYFEGVLRQADLETIRRRISELRREAYL
jgi:hypothetical protein